MGIAKRLKELRVDAKITQKELAEKTNIPLQSVINYENGRRDPNSKALVALERYFNVSGEYLRGESDEYLPRLNSWEDSETMRAVNDNLSGLLSNLEASIRANEPQEQKLSFDILVELLHVMKQKDEQARQASILLLQDVFALTTRFFDVCSSAQSGDEAASRVERAKQNALRNYERALSDALQGGLVPKPATIAEQPKRIPFAASGWGDITPENDELIQEKLKEFERVAEELKKSK